MFVKEGIYFPLFSDDNFCPHTSLTTATSSFPSSFLCQLFHEVTSVGRGSSFFRALDNFSLVRSLHPGVPSIVVIIMSAMASPTTQTRAEHQLKMTAPARVIASPFWSEICV